MPSPYDRSHSQDQGDTLAPADNLSDERMQELREAEQDALSSGGDAGPKTAVGRGIRDQATGKPQLNMGGGKFGSTKGGGSPFMSQGGKTGGGGAAVANFGDNLRQKLKDKESDSASKFYNSGADDSNRKGLANKARMQKKIALAGALSGVVGGGMGFAGLGIVSGPLQFMQWGQGLVDNHLSEKSEQSDARAYTMIRNFRLWAAGTPERTRMGMVGNAVTDRIEKKMRNTGTVTNYNNRNGFSNKIVLDARQLTTPDGKFRGGTPQQAIDFLQKERKIRATNGGNGRIVIDPNQPGFGYRQNIYIYKAAAAVAGYGKRVGAMVARIFGVRTGVSWHPIQKEQRKFSTKAERKAAFAAERNDKMRSTANPVRAGTQTQVDEEGRPNPESQGAAEEFEKLQQEGRDAEAKFNAGDKTALDTFRQSVYTKLAGGGLAAIGALCLLLFLAENQDEVDQAQKEIVMMKMAADSVALSEELKSSHENLDGNTEKLEFYGELMTDEKKRNTVFDALSYNAEMGRANAGVEIPETGMIGDDRNIVTRILTSIPGLNAFCDAAGTVVGGTVLFIAGALLGGFVREALTTILFIGALQILAPIIADIFAAVPVDPNAEGADKGNFENYGGRLSGNDIGNANAGLPMTDADANTLSGIQRTSLNEEFQAKSVAHKIFNTEDRQSVISQFILTQKPDPGANVANAAVGFLNLGKSFGSMLTKPLLASAGAAPLSPYNYGFPNIGFTEEEMNNPRYNDPFANANRVADLLDGAKGAEYVTRAKTCFGVTLSKKAYEDGIQRWGTTPPVEGDSPTRKTILDPANKCYGEGTTDSIEENKQVALADVDWMDTRFFIFDSNVMNAVGCNEGDETACCDVGMKNCGTGAAPAGQAGPAPTCSGTGNTGGAITGPGPLNNPIPANPVIDPISPSVVAEFPSPSQANAYAYGVTVVCSGPTDPVYTVSSGNADWGPNAFDQVVNVKGGSGSCNPLHIPDGTQPPSGTDGWVAVIDSTKPGLYCLMWIAQNNGGSWSMAYGGVYDLAGGGVPVLAGSGSGSDIPQSPILVSEIEAGVINHALGFASPKNQGGVRPPATKTDGGGGPGPFVEGMRFQLDPTFDCNTMPTKAEKAVCVALQVYGAYDVDNTGGGTGWFFQANDPAGVYPAAGITGDYMYFENIPMDRMRLLAKWEGN